MPNSPFPPRTRNTSSVVTIGSRVVGGPNIPTEAISTRVSAPPTVFTSGSFGLTNYIVSGAYSGTLAVACPATPASSHNKVTDSINLTGFPSPFTLVAGTTGLVLVSSSIASSTDATGAALVGNVSTTFRYGANFSSTSGFLTGGLTYTQPAVSVTLTVANIGAGAIPAFSLTLVVQAILLGAVIGASAFSQPI